MHVDEAAIVLVGHKFAWFGISRRVETKESLLSQRLVEGYAAT
jgi:hypothetical protein